MFTGMLHVGFTVADLDAAAAFYQELFGAPPRVRRIFDAPYTAEQVGYPGARLDVAHFDVPGSAAFLELIQYLEPAGAPVDVETCNPGTGHLCLASDDVDGAFARLVELGAVPRSTAPIAITSGPNEGRRVAYFRDPQGLTIEIMEAR